MLTEVTSWGFLETPGDNITSFFRCLRGRSPCSQFGLRQTMLNPILFQWAWKHFRGGHTCTIAVEKYLMLDECWRWIQHTGVSMPYLALHVQVMGSTSTSWNSQTGNRDLRQNRSRKKKLLERGNMEERLQTNPQIFDTVCIDFSSSR